MAELLVQAGLEITGQLLMPGEGRPQACLLARKVQVQLPATGR